MSDSSADSRTHNYQGFKNPDIFDEWFRPVYEKARVIEKHFSRQSEIMGYCDCCSSVVNLKIESGAHFDGEPNLREGFICPQGVTNRQRLLIRLINKTLQFHTEKIRLALFEDQTPMASYLRKDPDLDVHCSVYLDGDHTSGENCTLHNTEVSYQDITKTSYNAGTFDVAVHNDVLEHVPDYRAALRECCRVLKPGGLMLMTAPFFPSMQNTQTLARLLPDGSIEHLIEPPEYHGDPIAGSILAFYRFGWELLADIRQAGFRDAFVVCDYDPFSGLTTNNNHNLYGNMPPIAIIGLK